MNKTDSSKNTEETTVLHDRAESPDSGYGNGQERFDCGNIMEEKEIHVGHKRDILLSGISILPRFCWKAPGIENYSGKAQ